MNELTGGGKRRASRSSTPLANCGRMSAALQNRYGLSADDVAFFDLFATPPPQFEDDSIQIIQAGLDRGIGPRSVGRAARLIQAYELMYWDALCVVDGGTTGRPGPLRTACIGCRRPGRDAASRLVLRLESAIAWEKKSPERRRNHTAIIQPLQVDNVHGAPSSGQGSASG